MIFVLKKKEGGKGKRTFWWSHLVGLWVKYWSSCNIAWGVFCTPHHSFNSIMLFIMASDFLQAIVPIQMCISTVRVVVNILLHYDICFIPVGAIMSLTSYICCGLLLCLSDVGMVLLKVMTDCGLDHIQYKICGYSRVPV